MKANALKQKIADGVNCVGGWVAIPNPFAAEIYAAILAYRRFPEEIFTSLEGRVDSLRLRIRE